MPQDTKIRLTALQLQTLGDTAFFDVKRDVTQLISLLFQELQEALTEEWNRVPWSASVESPAPKIFKGENYKGYPYVNLDFPRLFRSDNVFAFRTLFWWGHSFSFTLHLQGGIYHERKANLFAGAHALKGKGYYLCVNDTPWEYHFEPANYVLLDEVLLGNGLEALQGTKEFVKLSRRLELTSYTELVQEGKRTFNELTGVLSATSR